MKSVLVLGLAVTVVAACRSSETSESAPAPAPRRERVPVAHVDNESNITRADYIGPDACGECHPTEHARWTDSLHRVMNAKVDDAGAVIGNFSDAHVAHKTGTATMTRAGATYVMTTSDGERTTRYHVTRTIGHRGLQEYVGVADGASAEVRLPFGWWPRAGGWQPQVAFDPWLDDAHFDAFAPVREPWAERCPWCHSTYPFAQRIARSSAKAVGHGLEQFFTSPPGSETLDVAAQVTTGISCESCHLGGRAHAEGAPIQFVPRGATKQPGAPPFPTTFAAQRTDANVINTVCAQCHSGPSPRLADGTSVRNSSEALDLRASSCTGLKCTDCHDPHRADAHPDEAKVVAVCTGCHAPQATPAHAGASHTGASACLDCHMPRVVMGIDRYVRTHRISSPTDPRVLADAGPNACNLCHLDRSIDWTLTELRLGWDAKPAVRSRNAYGTDDASVGDIWLASPSPAIRLIAAHAYARSPLGRYAVPALTKALADPLPYVRMWMQFALDDIKR